MPRLLVLISLSYFVNQANGEGLSCKHLFELRESSQQTMPQGFAQRLKESIEETGYRQYYFNALLQYSTNTMISKVVSGGKRILLHDVVILADVLGLNTWWLLTGEGEKYAPNRKEDSPFISDYDKKNSISQWRAEFGRELANSMREARVSGLALSYFLNYDPAKISKVIQGHQEFLPVAAVESVRFLRMDPNILNFRPSAPDSKIAPLEQKSILQDISTEILIDELKNRGWFSGQRKKLF